MKIVQPTPDDVTKLDLRSEEEKLCAMTIHESFSMNSVDILRVIGGWIYSVHSINYYEDCEVMSSTFVPLP